LDELSANPHIRENREVQIQHIRSNKKGHKAANAMWGAYSTEWKGQLLDYWDDIPYVYAGSIAHKEAILAPGSNKKAHPCQMPEMLAARCILFFTEEGDEIFDPFAGSGTTLVAARKLRRHAVGCEQEIEYCSIAANRLEQCKTMFEVR
jgi:DNA modification methylase